MKRITVRNIHRRTPEDITTLAREVIQGRALVTADARVIESAFYVMLAMMPPFSDAAMKVMGGLIGWDKDTVPGRAMNGYPIFLSCGFLHKADIPAFDAELERMRLAIGLPS